VAGTFLVTMAPALACQRYGLEQMDHCKSAFGPLGGILFADFVFLRRQKLNIWAIFDDDPSTEYYYSRGFNWPALVCVVLGMAVYLYLLDPITYEAHTLFRYLTASLPACVVPGVVYWAWMRGLGLPSPTSTSEEPPRHLLRPNI
jgi:NCS1 family nucleobase:cation symporter-1